MKHTRPTVLYVAAVRDATGVNASPGAVLVQHGKVVAAGKPDNLPVKLLSEAEVIDRRGDLLLPALVNAHTHLELTDIGPQPYDPAGGFVGWVKMVRQRTHDMSAKISTDYGGIASPRRGIELLSRPSGIQAVGDIVPNVGRARLREISKFDGVSYLELFGIGEPYDTDAINLIDQVDCGLQPHAPYSAGPAVFEAASRSSKPVSTHLAETLDEIAFVKERSGPLLEYLRSIGKWDDAFAGHYGKGLSPVQWMRPYLKNAATDGGWLVAHCNYVSDEDIAILADTNTSVAYCPIASEYFGHMDHRYRDMLVAGINVCLGTDSILGTDPDDPQPLGLLSAMRRLYQRDQTDPDTLLAMATVHGTRALRLDEKVATLQPGAPACFACLPIDPETHTDPLVQALTRQDPVEAILFDEST